MTTHFFLPPSVLRVEDNRKQNLSRALLRPLDRVNVLGDNGSGHTGCVNALSWCQDGELLLSGGDDTAIRVWRMDTSNIEQEYPFVCRSVISTGHRANIFNAQMLPKSSRIATAAGDEQVRVFDVGSAPGAAPDGAETEYNSHQSCIRILRCHDDRVKRIVVEDSPDLFLSVSERIVVEDSPDLFLSVSEDGTVRQHDMRTSHNCRDATCPAPLTKVNHELSTLSLSPVTPYQFVVAGEAPYGYLYDRRHVGRVLKREWGEVPRAGEEVTTCVRRFGRLPKEKDGERSSRRDHVTGARISPSNGHEVLLSYSGDRVYLYSTRDQPCSDDDLASPISSIVPANATKQSQKTPLVIPYSGSSMEPAEETTDQHIDLEDEDVETFVEFNDPPKQDYQADIPMIMPRCQYVGARNVATIKDVNFLGPRDEWVVSGSDDGNFFMWSKGTGSLQGIYEGDSSVVNVIEGHPHFPLVAVSGIDTTVKLFAPTDLPSVFSRVDNADRIIESNERLSRTRTVRYNFSAVLQAAMGGEEVSLPQCANQ